jgi:hypothetical protein
MPTKNFFPSLLAPIHPSCYPFLYTIRKTPFPDSSTDMLLNCNPPTYSPILDSSTSTLLNCNLTQTTHDMPSGYVRHLSHLSNWMDDMPSGHPDILLGYWPGDMPSSHLDILLGYWLGDMPSGHPDILLGYWPGDMPSSHLDSFGHFGLLGHLGHSSLLGHLGYLSTISNLNALDPEPIDAPLHAFIEEEEPT